MTPTVALVLELIKDGLEIIEAALQDGISDEEIRKELSTWTTRLDGAIRSLPTDLEANDAEADAILRGEKP